MRPGGVDWRAILLGVDPARAMTIRLRDRVVAAGVPLVIVPLGLLFVGMATGSPGYLGIGMIPAYGSYITVPAFPVAVLLSYPFSRRGLIGMVPFFGAGAFVGLAVAMLFGLLTWSEGTATAGVSEVMLSALSFGLVGAVYAAVAWLVFVAIRIDLYFLPTEVG